MKLDESEKLRNEIEEMRDVEKISADAMQILIASLNNDYAMVQEVSYREIKKLKYEIVIKKQKITKDLNF